MVAGVFKKDLTLIPDTSLFWQSLDPSKNTDCVQFQEILMVAKFGHDKTPTPVGSMCLNVQASSGDSNKLVVYVRSELTVDDRKGGSKILTHLDPGLHTIEEKREEFIGSCVEHFAEPICKQNLYVALERDSIHIHHKLDSCDGHKENTIIQPILLGRQLVCEGSSFVLMRILAIHKYIGHFETTTLYLNGQICRNIYTCLGPESGKVNGTKMDICKIHRQIEEPCGIVHQCNTTLTMTGHIVTHEWNNCDYVVCINPLTDVNTLKPGEISREKVDWCRDFQLFSVYLDRKELCTSRLKSYIKDRPEIQQILADYVQVVLQMKPTDVVEFTTEYFNRFSV